MLQSIRQRIICIYRTPIILFPNYYFSLKTNKDAQPCVLHHGAYLRHEFPCRLRPFPHMRHNKIRTHEPCVPTGQWMSRLKFPLAFYLAGRDARSVRPSSGGHICVMSSLAGCALPPYMRHHKIRTHEWCVPTGLCDCSLGCAKCSMCLAEIFGVGCYSISTFDHLVSLTSHSAIMTFPSLLMMDPLPFCSTAARPSENHHAWS